MTTLLPKRIGDFASQTYWNHFFQTRDSPFEWYGDFLQHSNFFHKYVKKSDHVLVIGCGNSELGFMLHKHIQCASVLNIDNNNEVIMKMSAKHQAERASGLHYECADVLKWSEQVESLQAEATSCVVDKGTLDAIYSDDAACDFVSNLFTQLTGRLKPMGRYILISLAQRHIVDSLCDFFIENSDEWLINCHQLTSNISSDQSSHSEFPLPVYGFVFTKLMASLNLPRVSVYPFESSDGILLNKSDLRVCQLAKKLGTWIDEEQRLSLLRHDVSSGKQRCFRFECSLTGLTAFYCQIVSSQSKSSRKSHHALKSGADHIQAVFLIPFGQTNHARYMDEKQLISLCKSLKLRCLLVAYVNPRYFQPDIEALKLQLSSALQSLPHTISLEGFPILSTPNCFDRTEILRLDHGLIIDEVALHLDGDQIEQRFQRLVYPTSDLRPILSTNVSLDQSDGVLPAHDKNVILWCHLLLKNVTNPTVSYFGLPLFRCLPEEASVRIIQLNKDSLSIENLLLDRLYSKPLESGKCYKRPVNVAEVEDGFLCDVVVYDPCALCNNNYMEYFSRESLLKLCAYSARHSRESGFLLIAFAPKSHSNLQKVEFEAGISTVFTCGDGDFECLLSYTVPDPMMSDPPTQVVILQKCNAAKIIHDKQAWLKNLVSSSISHLSSNTKTLTLSQTCQDIRNTISLYE